MATTQPWVPAATVTTEQDSSISTQIPSASGGSMYMPAALPPADRASPPRAWSYVYFYAPDYQDAWLLWPPGWTQLHSTPLALSPGATATRPNIATQSTAPSHTAASLVHRAMSAPVLQLWANRRAKIVHWRGPEVYDDGEGRSKWRRALIS
ncbi:uncharacterized protein BP5553_01760 [Venustampulla echinocandica]|uniref:Uncharacterized protein n=1 Tax=Venustampulla echinocandica TaxID=2656787 RepID=A0A370U1Z4_9HELO|nr:uncharacterized protein BP5553_01760 [Venustampulla echinocandica]RDL41781.1 hypothetical protein BP5553_01760 [Venustampulla echinocandica]